jgi:hypothetical protein
MNYQNPHAPSCPWYDITQRTGAPNIKWCEETLCQWISEPANTWSNLGYLIVGLFIVIIASKKNHNRSMKQFGPIIIFMGAMSFFYHLSNFYGSQILDFVGMFFFVGWAIGMNLIRLGKLKDKNLIWFNLVLGGMLVLAMHVMYLMGIKYQVLIILTALIIIATEMMARKLIKVHYGWFGVTLLTLIIAFGFSISDGQRIWCHPSEHGWLSQGHAVWHWVAAIGMLTIYLHYAQPALRPQEQK